MADKKTLTFALMDPPRNDRFRRAGRDANTGESGRLIALPDIPTVAETLPGYEAAAFTGVGVPTGTPEPIIARLNREINAGLNDPGIKARLAELIVAPLVLTPAEFGAYMTAETAKWAKVIKLANIKAE